MSVTAMSRVWRGAPDLSGSELLVMLALADWCNDACQCWPSIGEVARKSRLSERGTRYVLRSLEVKGYILRDEQRGRNHTNKYILVLSEDNRQPLQVSGEKENLQNLQVATQNLQVDVLKPAIAIAPEPSLTIIKPSLTIGGAENKKARGTSAPDNFEVTINLRTWALEKNIVCDLDAETEAFLDYHHSKGDTSKDWIASWRTWMRNTRKFGGYTNGKDKQSPKQEATREFWTRLAKEAAEVGGFEGDGGPNLFLPGPGTAE